MTVPDSGPELARSIPSPADGRIATVVHLADGDSFVLRWSDNGERDEVRLVGINAPERDACFGTEARAVLEALTAAGGSLVVEGAGRDEFGRLLADVWSGGVFLNVAMAERGAALAIAGDGSHAALIDRAQARARSEGQGLWAPGECVAESSVSIRTIEFDAPGPDDQRPNEEWIEIEAGAESVDLSGWSIRDESTRNRFDFPDGFVLDASGRVKVRSGCGDDDSDDLFWCAADPVWNNGGDTGFLVDPAGRFVDTFAY